MVGKGTILLLFVAVTTASAGPLRFSRTSVSHTTPPMSIRIENVRTTAMGWRKCTAAFTTRAPALTWEIDERMEMRIDLQDQNGAMAQSSGVIVLPDKSYVCASDKKSFWLRNWPAGVYKLFLTSPNSAAFAVVHFDNPLLEKQQMTTAVSSLPEIVLGPTARNPQFTSVPATFAIDAANAGATCAKSGRVMALARVRVDKPSRWFIDLDHAAAHGLFVLTADKHCIDPRTARDIPAGNHTLWTVVEDGTAPSSFALEIDDRNAPLSFGDAVKKPVGALDYPLVVDGKVRASQRWFARAGACAGAARDPDFYLVTDKPLQKVTLSLLWSRAHPKLHVFGPIDRAQPAAEPSCDSSDHTIDVLDGTYAVWVGADSAAGTPFHVLVRRDGTKLDPMTTLVDPPTDLGLADRALNNHYPYFQGKALDDWTKLFTTAPDQLFVYTRNDVDLGDDKLAAGEPLLVASSKGDVTVAYRDDGIQVHLDTRFVTTQKPVAITLPTIARTPKLDDLGAAIAVAGPEDAKSIADYRAVEAKHDAAKLAAAKAKLLKDLDTTRRHRYKQHLIAVRKRFGL
ncbi:MAG TPA: hypothetical protein VGO00_23175 [Kofleriaceae bacterium]|nr:hypothetical protein [Kofleriaceae bacterium]